MPLVFTHLYIRDIVVYIKGNTLDIYIYIDREIEREEGGGAVLNKR
jgi:hypothetical protein